MAVPQLFGIVPTSCPIITIPSSVPTETSFTFTLPSHSFSHIVVFLLPGVCLPPETAAAVYLGSTSPPLSTASPNFRFLGGIGPGKESAIFKVNNDIPNSIGQTAAANGLEVMDAREGSTHDARSRNMILGISVEPSSSVAARIASLSVPRTSPGAVNDSKAPLFARPQQPDTLKLAQRIISNAFNFLASFSGNVPIPGASGTAGVEVVPLKAFEEWWKKFEGRVRSEPGFLERDHD